jgi:DNA-binding CsgD family transcriptional regulator
MREAIGAPTPAYRREAVSRAEEAAARALGEAVYHAAWLSGRGADPASLLPTVPTPAAVAAGGALSPRELEVLRIIAAGDTDAEAAEQLYVSVRTVHGHLQAIYRKLGVRTRTAAAAWAHDQGL